MASRFPDEKHVRGTVRTASFGRAEVAQKDILDASVTALLGWGEPWATDVHSLRNAWVACATAALSA